MRGIRYGNNAAYADRIPRFCLAIEAQKQVKVGLNTPLSCGRQDLRTGEDGFPSFLTGMRKRFLRRFENVLPKKSQNLAK